MSRLRWTMEDGVADWQVEFHVVPQARIAAVAGPLPPAALAATDWWDDRAIDAVQLERLGAIGPLAPSSGPDHRQWGSELWNRVDIWSRGGRVQRIAVRVDVRKLDARFGAALLGFVRATGAVLVRADGAVVPPTIDAYSAALRGSKAWRFANDTATWLATQFGDDDAG
ncbi:MAG: hypothetical protein ACYC4J_02285 [Gemmatimonadaceae bacterium]